MKKNIFLNASGIILLSNVLGMGISPVGADWSQNSPNSWQQDSWHSQEDRSGWHSQQDRSGWQSQQDRNGWESQEDRSGWKSQDRSEYWNRPTSYADSDFDSPTTTFRKPADTEIYNRAQGIIEKGDYRNIDIHVLNGVVTLRGQIQTDEEKDQLENKIQRIDGIKSIDNRLNIMSDRNQTASFGDRDDDTQSAIQRPNTIEQDQSIKNQATRTLEGGFFTTGYPNVRVEVHNGNVILTGRVDNQNDLADIEKKVRKISGVKNITNQIRVASN